MLFGRSLPKAGPRPHFYNSTVKVLPYYYGEILLQTKVILIYLVSINK